MPSLTLDTSPKPQRGRSSSNSGPDSRSTSPGQAPPFSPITPTLSAARLAASSSTNAQQGIPHTYTHSQSSQVGITQPPPIAIDFETNPDALALKSAIAVLLNQSKTAKNDINILERIKARAMADPEDFLRALGSGEIKSRGDPLFNPSAPDGNDDDDDDEMMEQDESKKSLASNSQAKPPWDSIPTPQTVVRMPPINWAQYGIVGESLDKIHSDQISRPAEGMPARIGPDGQILHGSDGRRQLDLGVAAPYNPSRDKLEKMGTRKGGKR